MKQSENVPLVSIITPVYNGAAFIEELILSIKSQSYSNIEHIVINDGSEDEGATVRILQRYPHLRWWSHPKKCGQYVTMNEGLEHASGQLVCFINADDLLTENAVQHATDWLSTHPEFDGVYGLTSYILEDGKPYPIKYPFRRASLRYYPYFTQLQHCSLYISRTTILEKELRFDPAIRFVADYDWILRILNAGTRIGFTNFFLSTIRSHNNQISKQNRELMIKEQIEVANRNGFGGFRFRFYIKVLHAADFVEQLRYAFKKGRFTGVKSFINNWITCKLKARIQDK